MPPVESVRSSWVWPVLIVGFVLAAGVLLWASVSTPQAEAGGAGVVLLATASLLRRSLPSSATSASAPAVGRLVAQGLSPRSK
jgi:hydrogenase/urease accessory protein HupE